MDDADRKKYKKLYLKTGRAYLQDMEKNIEAIRKKHHPENAIENLYICAHSLRSQSLLMGYAELGNYLEGVERILHTKQRHLLEFDYKLLMAIDSGVRKMINAMNEIENGKKETDFIKEIRSLQNVAGTKLYI